MCPGPILVNIGEGKIYALAALAGALAGAATLGGLYQRLRSPFNLPQVLEKRTSGYSRTLRLSWCPHYT